jgi:hypothetical protein
MQDQPRQDLRALKALVGGMGVLIVLGTALVIGVVIHRLYARNPAPSNIAVATVPVPEGAMGATRLAPGNVAASLAAGEKIMGITGAGGDVAVWVSGPAGDRLLLIDPQSGQTRVVLSTNR